MNLPSLSADAWTHFALWALAGSIIPTAAILGVADAIARRKGGVRPENDPSADENGRLPGDW